MLRLALAAFAAFASTNVDDLFVLVVLFGAGRRARVVVAGQYAGFAAIVAVSLAVSAGALLFRPEWVGFLGIAPFAIGVKALVARRAARGERVSGAAIGVWGIAAVTFANGGDNIAVYVPLFARRTSLEIAAMLVVFALMVAVWCAAAHSLVRAPPIARALERWGHWIAPVVSSRSASTSSSRRGPRRTCSPRVEDATAAAARPRAHLDEVGARYYSSIGLND